MDDAVTLDDHAVIASDSEFVEDFTVRQAALDQMLERINRTPIATLEALKSYTPQVDEYQRSVVETTAHTVRVVAPAGSGKTQTVINRVLQQALKGQNPQRVLILTFDNAAAYSLRKTLSRALDEVQGFVNEPAISTLNAFGFRILREYVTEEYKPIIDDYRRRRLMRLIIADLEKTSSERYRRLPSNIAETFYLEFFSLLKNELFDPRSLDAQAFADFLLASEQASVFFPSSTDEATARFVIQAIIWLYKAYEKNLQDQKLMDFDDQKLRAYQVLLGDEDIRTRVQSLHSEIIVDEFQDINKLDFHLIRVLAKKTRLVVTGDDDQAIYGFRGCSPEYIINLSHYLAERGAITPFELRKNYRCPANIVKHANRLISNNNPNRIPKEPIPVKSELAEIKIVSSLTAGLEAKLVVNFIKRVRRNEPSIPLREFAILYRTNAQSLPLQVEFVLSNIPYHVRKKDNLLENRILDRLLGTLRAKKALLNQKTIDPMDCVRVVESYFRYVSASQSDRLFALFTQGGSFWNTISSQPFFQILPKAEISYLLPAVNEMVKAKTLIDTLDVLSRRFKGLRGMIGSLEDVIDERVPLGEVFDLAANFGGDLNQFVATMEQALSLAKAVHAGTDEEGGVRLLTYFKAKGLQWHTVILTTCNDGLIPHKRSPLEDERRLFYVAITRAEQNLVLSYVRNVCNNKVEPSRFLAEAGFRIR